MFCPLCKAEYREGFSRCENCHSDLVSSLDLPEVRSNPSALLWVGKDVRHLTILAQALWEARIPCHAPGLKENHMVQLPRESEIRVRVSDFDAAIRISTEAASRFPHPHSRSPSLRCYQCNAENWPGFARCSQCGAVLLADLKAEQFVPPVALTGARLCPLCQSLFGATHTRCTQCGVELIAAEAAERPLDPAQAGEPLELAWRGSDPIAVSRVLEALRSAAIPHYVKATHDNLAFELGMPRARYEVSVLGSDLLVVQSLAAPIREIHPFVSEEAEPAALEEKSGGRPRSAPGPFRRWLPREATVEAWSGDDAALAGILRDCLLENRIESRQEGAAPGTLLLLVRPEEAGRAREIVREVVEGAPPA
jgi:hypothetical protein